MALPRPYPIGPFYPDFLYGALLGVLTVSTVVLGVYWVPVIALADRSVRFLMG